MTNSKATFSFFICNEFGKIRWRNVLVLNYFDLYHMHEGYTARSPVRVLSSFHFEVSIYCPISSSRFKFEEYISDYIITYSFMYLLLLFALSTNSWWLCKPDRAQICSGVIAKLKEVHVPDETEGEPNKVKERGEREISIRGNGRLGDLFPAMSTSLTRDSIESTVSQINAVHMDQRVDYKHDVLHMKHQDMDNDSDKYDHHHRDHHMLERYPTDRDKDHAEVISLASPSSLSLANPLDNEYGEPSDQYKLVEGMPFNPFIQNSFSCTNIVFMCKLHPVSSVWNRRAAKYQRIRI